MKKVLALLVAAMLLLSTGAALAQEKEPVTIRFYNYALSEAAKADWWKDIVASFEEKNPWVTVESVTVDYNSMIQTFTNDLGSGMSVDLILGEVSWIPALVDGEFIQQPKDVIDPAFYAGYYDYVLDQMTYGGGVYAVPHYYTNSVVFINKDLVEAAGMKADAFPTTLDDLKAWIETLNAFYQGSGKVSTIFGLTTAEVPATGSNINAIFTAFGGQLLTDDGKLADLKAEPNATAMAEMLDFYKYLIGNGYTQENLKLKDYRAAFGAGNVVAYVDSSWGYAQIGEVDANAANFTVTAPLPTAMGTYGQGNSLVESHCFLIGDGLSDEQKEAVSLFIQYCTNTENLQGYLNNIGLAFIAHEGMADCQISPILAGAAQGVSHVQRQTQIGPMVSVQKQLATLVLDYTVNGASLEDAVNSYITEAEYFIDQ
ncbi:MAG: extracellular solute-binding protein [Clostridia bacterium]|nr:extracellular solute-binding protein [Clostridia bacterium]